MSATNNNIILFVLKSIILKIQIFSRNYFLQLIDKLK